MSDAADSGTDTPAPAAFDLDAELQDIGRSPELKVRRAASDRIRAEFSRLSQENAALREEIRQLKAPSWFCNKCVAFGKSLTVEEAISQHAEKSPACNYYPAWNWNPQPKT